MPGPASDAVALIALGSNLGDSPRILQAAIARLVALSVKPPRRSSLWRTTPVECSPGSPHFVNAVVMVFPQAEETPETLLDKLQAIEREFGRPPKEALNEPRPLDLDLIAFGGEKRATPRLLLPHPRACQRRFVLAPLAEIAPDLRLPGQTKTVRRLLADLQTDEVVARLESTPPYPVRAEETAFGQGPTPFR